jgi:hypothetical protein
MQAPIQITQQSFPTEKNNRLAKRQAIHAQGEQIGQCCLDFPAVGDIAVGKPFEPDRSPCYVPIAASVATAVENVVGWPPR